MHPQDAVELLAKGGAVLANVAKVDGARSSATFDATRKARELLALPPVGDSVQADKAVSRAFAKFRTTTKPHPLLEAARLVAMDASIAEMFEHMGAVRSLLANEPGMRQVLANIEKPMRIVREGVDDAMKHSRPCEVRHHLPLGRAPRLRTNHRTRGSRRAAGVRTGQDPGDDDHEADPDDVEHRHLAGGRR